MKPKPSKRAMDLFRRPGSLPVTRQAGLARPRKEGKPMARPRLGMRELRKGVREMLVAKYTTSQDFHFRNNVNSMVEPMANTVSIHWFDLLTSLDLQEFFKRFYFQHEYQYKMELLTEYYKFHRDIPRTFTRHISKVMDAYHNNRRSHEYKQVKKILMAEAQTNNKKLAVNEGENEIRYPSY
jgi:hypothetical protein